MTKRIEFRPHENGAAFSPSGFLGDSFNAYRDAARNAGASYVRELEANAIPGLDTTPTVVSALEGAGFLCVITPAMAEALRARAEQMRSDKASASERVDAVNARLADSGKKLFPFQTQGVNWLAPRDRALLADDMGLGKTVQALVSAPEGSPIIVVGPAVAKGVWRAEAAKWRPDLTPVVLKGRNSFRWPKAGELVITNYDILSNDVPAGCPANATLIADESHALKNNTAKRTERFRELGEAVRALGGRTWLLTATPLLNRPTELYSVLRCANLHKDAFGSWERFVEMFDGRKGRFGYEWGTDQDEKAIAEALQRVQLRRTKKGVLPQLPSKMYRDVPVNDLPAKVKALCDKVLGWLKENDIDLEAAIDRAGDHMPDFKGISAARAALAKAKIAHVLEFVDEYEEAGKPVVVFSAHRAAIDLIGKREGWMTITGSVSPAKRKEIEEKFQNGELKGIAATIKAGGVALTLTKSNNAFFVDLDWTPALNSQAEDRICRIGQDRGCVITRLVADHPLDQRINAVLIRKQALIGKSIEAAEVVEVQDHDLASELEALAARVVDAPKAEKAPKADTINCDKCGRELRVRTSGPKAKNPGKRYAKCGKCDSFQWADAEMKKAKSKRGPESAQERWAAGAVATLAELDPDRAASENGVGFNKMDGHFGHDMARKVEGGLTTAQWNAVIKLCRKYHRQVGACPEG